MPHFTLNLSPKGCIVNALVGVSRERLAALQKAGSPTPQPVAVQALIDTGASATCVDPFCLNSLNLTPTGVASVHTPSTKDAPTEMEQYDISIIIPAAQNQPPLSMPTLPVICTELLKQQGFHVLIGRDILQHCVFYYNGSINLFSVAY